MKLHLKAFIVLSLIFIAAHCGLKIKNMRLVDEFDR